MFSFDSAARLQLFLGPNVPLPAPYPVIDALREVEVVNTDRERDGFQMTFSLGKDTPVEFGLLATRLLDPPSRVVIQVILGGLPKAILHGVITQHQVVPSNTPGASVLIVTGEDLGVLMDLEEKSETYANRPDSAIVAEIVLGYGLVPKVTPTFDVPIELDQVPNQQDTDLGYIRHLAERNGFVFYIEPTVFPGPTIAYWGPEERIGLPQPALNVGLGADTNVEGSLTFRYDALAPVGPDVSITDPILGLRIPVPVPTGLRPPLAREPAAPLRKAPARDSASLGMADALLRGVSEAVATADAVTATGELDAVRYGRVLRSRGLVGVRGAGDSFDGLYYVRRVTHTIRRGSYKQAFTLSREGRGSITPAVIP